MRIYDNGIVEDVKFKFFIWENMESWIFVHCKTITYEN